MMDPRKESFGIRPADKVLLQICSGKCGVLDKRRNGFVTPKTAVLEIEKHFSTSHLDFLLV